MALLYCIDCGGQVSDQATNCPHCGRPIYRDEQTQRMTSTVIRGQYQQNTIPPNVQPKKPSDKPLVFIVAMLFLVLSIVLFIAKQYVVFALMFAIFCMCLSYLTYDSSSQNHGQPHGQKMRSKQLYCRKCGCTNIQVSVQNVEHIVGMSGEERKKGALTRAGNSIGRTGMILLTGGLWALTPKKSKYRERNKVYTHTMRYKTAVCQNCGHSWDM